MGVHNRDYMRDDGRRAIFSAGRITWWIIGINGVLWVIYSGAYHNAASFPGQPVSQVGGLATFMWEYLVLHPQDVISSLRIWEPFTAFWMHDPVGVSHVFWNMVLLFFFGRQAESSLGKHGYLRLYLGGGLTSTLVYMLWAFAIGTEDGALGASGCVYAVMVWVALQNPRKTVLLMFVIPVPIWLLVGLLMVGGEFMGLAQSGFQDGSAVGHLAGAAWGWFVWARFARVPTLSKSGPGAWISDLKRKREQAQREAGLKDEAADRARVEHLLQKISDEGMTALSEEEKRFLQEASRRYR